MDRIDRMWIWRGYNRLCPCENLGLNCPSDANRELLGQRKEAMRVTTVNAFGSSPI